MGLHHWRLWFFHLTSEAFRSTFGEFVWCRYSCSGNTLTKPSMMVFTLRQLTCCLLLFSIEGAFGLLKVQMELVLVEALDESLGELGRSTLFYELFNDYWFGLALFLALFYFCRHEFTLLVSFVFLLYLPYLILSQLEWIDCFIVVCESQLCSCQVNHWWY